MATGKEPVFAQADVVIIGAGINGSGIARDAAMRGMRVVLVERDDVSNATSAWSSPVAAAVAAKSGAISRARTSASGNPAVCASMYS